MQVMKQQSNEVAGLVKNGGFVQLMDMIKFRINKDPF